jgi:hypothetical protein
MASTYLDDVARRGADDGRVAREAEDRPEKEGKHRAREHLEPGPYFMGGPDGLVRYCYFIPKHWRMASAAHGLPKVLLGPTMPNPSTPCGRTPLKQPYSRFSGGRPHGWRPAAILYLHGHPKPYASVPKDPCNTALTLNTSFVPVDSNTDVKSPLEVIV